MNRCGRTQGRSAVYHFTLEMNQPVVFIPKLFACLPTIFIESILQRFTSAPEITGGKI
jgi:hypothetical protein